jgi:hypothetical protein
MLDSHITTIQAIADIGSATWKTAKKWSGVNTFPAKGAKGWNRTEVTAWVAQRLKKAAQSQTGDNSDLKRQILAVRLKILNSDLATREIGLSNAAADTVPREVLLAALNAYSGAVYSSLRAWRDYIANDPIRAISPAQYDLLGGDVAGLLAAMKRGVGYFLDSPTTAFDEPIDITFTEDEKLKCSESFRYQA